MNLYLVRHGTASHVAPCDAERELTAEGRREAEIVGRALMKLGVVHDAILASPLVRARQTAEIIAERLGRPGTVMVVEELCNGHSTAALLRAVHPRGEEKGMVLVGHMPSLAEHLNLLIGATPTANTVFGTATAAAVRMTDWRQGAGELHWFLRQAQLAAIAAGD
jgi:phosphohistidine phosphatase